MFINLAALPNKIFLIEVSPTTDCQMLVAHCFLSVCLGGKKIKP
jgi:hypothetical protein